MDRKVAVAWLNIFGLLAIVSVITGAFIFQFYYQELPCPLCMLQRLGLLLAGFGFLLNFRYGFKPSHYALSLLGALFVICASTRQVFLHILPGDPGFGSPLLGLHLYTWVTIFGFFGIFYIAVTLLVQGGMSIFYFSPEKRMQIFINILCYALFVLTLLNVITVFLICGIGVCPANPINYLFFR